MSVCRHEGDSRGVSVHVIGAEVKNLAPVRIDGVDDVAVLVSKVLHHERRHRPIAADHTVRKCTIEQILLVLKCRIGDTSDLGQAIRPIPFVERLVQLLFVMEMVSDTFAAGKLHIQQLMDCAIHALR